MKIYFKSLLIIGFILALPKITLAASLSDPWSVSCPTYVGAESCGTDYVNTAAPQALTCAPLATMNSRYSSCTTALGGTLQCSGTCSWTSNTAFCDPLNKNTTTLTKSLTGPTGTDYSPKPNLDVCGGCKSGYVDYGAGCVPILDNVAINRVPDPDEYFAVPPSGSPVAVTIGADLWKENGAGDVYRDTGRVGIGESSPAAVLHVKDPAINLDSTFGGLGVAVTGVADGGGGLFTDANSTGGVYLANDDIGITAFGSAWAGYFDDNDQDFNEAWISIGAYSMLTNGPINLNVTNWGSVYVAGDEALWYDGSNVFSWGYGGKTNYFDDKVGIGTSTPTQKLEVVGNAQVDGQGYFDGNVYVNKSVWPGNGYLQILADSGYGAYLELYESAGGTGTDYGFKFKYDGAPNKLYLLEEGGGSDEAIRMTVEHGTGDVGIGLSNPAYKLDVNGTMRVRGTAYIGAGHTWSLNTRTDNGDMEWVSSVGGWAKRAWLSAGDGHWYYASDERLKNIDSDFTKGLSTIAALQPKNFTWKSDDQNAPMKVGLIAQDLQKVLPEAVYVGSDSEHLLGIDASVITVTLVNAVKELKAENDELKSVVCELKPDAKVCNK